MKETLKIVLIFAAFMLIIPLIGFMGNSSEEYPAEEKFTEAESSIIEAEPPLAENTEDNFLVLDITSGQVMNMTMREYLIGAVIAEMPATYEVETLKAQAVIAHTYALRRISLETLNPTAELMGAYISNDSTVYQAFFTPEQGKAFYGEAYDEYRLKIENAVDSVYPEALYYDGEPISAAFHSISCGKTDSALDVWGTDIPYLTSVDSNYDCEAPTFYSEAVFTADEIRSKFEDTDPDCPDDELITISDHTEGGYVKSALVGGYTYSGNEIRAALGLRSASFSVEYKDKSYVFNIKGNGHGVGLSQYGANCLAKEGKSYREILSYYYNGTTIE